MRTRYIGLPVSAVCSSMILYSRPVIIVSTGPTLFYCFDSGRSFQHLSVKSARFQADIWLKLTAEPWFIILAVSIAVGVKLRSGVYLSSHVSVASGIYSKKLERPGFAVRER